MEGTLPGEDHTWKNVVAIVCKGRLCPLMVTSERSFVIFPLHVSSENVRIGAENLSDSEEGCAQGMLEVYELTCMSFHVTFWYRPTTVVKMCKQLRYISWKWTVGRRDCAVNGVTWGINS